jgi:hypothetical protein
MALKDFDDVNPRTRDKNWKEEIPQVAMPKMDEWYGFRIVGGVFTYAQHWIEFQNKNGETKRYPVDCANWDQSTESTSKKGNCPVCELGERPGVRYMMNVIDREAQQSGSSDPIRALDIAPTVMRQIIDLKKLNTVKGQAYSVAHPKFGTDIFLMKQRSKKRGGVEWAVQKGDRSPLTEEEQAFEFISFDEHYLEPDVHRIREDLKRHGYFNDGDEDSTKVPGGKKPMSKKMDDEEEDVKPSKKPSKPAVDDDDDDDVPVRKPAAKKPAVDDDDDDVPVKKPAKKPVVDDDDDVKPAKKAKPVVDDDDDDDDVVPAKKPAKAAAPAKPIKRAPVDDDDFDDDADDDE